MTSNILETVGVVAVARGHFSTYGRNALWHPNFRLTYLKKYQFFLKKCPLQASLQLTLSNLWDDQTTSSQSMELLLNMDAGCTTNLFGPEMEDTTELKPLVVV